MIYICGKTTSAWNNLSILNTPYYDNSGIVIMNDAFRYIVNYLAQM